MIYRRLETVDRIVTGIVGLRTKSSVPIFVVLSESQAAGNLDHWNKI